MNSLSKVLAYLAILASLSGCVTAMSKSEYQNSAVKSFDQQKFVVSGVGYSIVKERLIEYAEECLGLKGHQFGGPRQGSYTTTYVPTLEQKGDLLSLYLNYKVEGSFNSSTSAYVFSAQIKETKTKEVEGVAFYYSGLFYDTSDVSKRMIAWLKDEKNLCPQLY